MEKLGDSTQKFTGDLMRGRCAAACCRRCAGLHRADAAAMPAARSAHRMARRVRRPAMARRRCTGPRTTTIRQLVEQLHQGRRGCQRAQRLRLDAAPGGRGAWRCGDDPHAAEGRRGRGVRQRRRADRADDGGPRRVGRCGQGADQGRRQRQRSGAVARPDGADVGRGAGQSGDGAPADQVRRQGQRTYRPCANGRAR